MQDTLDGHPPQPEVRKEHDPKLTELSTVSTNFGLGSSLEHSSCRCAADSADAHAAYEANPESSGSAITGAHNDRQPLLVHCLVLGVLNSFHSFLHGIRHVHVHGLRNSPMW